MHRATLGSIITTCLQERNREMGLQKTRQAAKCGSMPPGVRAFDNINGIGNLQDREPNHRFPFPSCPATLRHAQRHQTDSIGAGDSVRAARAPPSLCLPLGVARAVNLESATLSIVPARLRPARTTRFTPCGPCRQPSHRAMHVAMARPWAITGGNQGPNVMSAPSHSEA